MGMVTRDEDGVLHLYVANTHDSVLFFTNRGKVFHLKAHEIPEQTRTARGVPLINMVGIDVDEQATGLIVVRNFEVAENLLFVTRKGEVKRVRLADFANVRSTGIKAMDLDASDELVWVKLAGEKDDAILISSDGKAVRFALEDVRLSNRGSGGMRGMKLLGADTLVGAEIVDKAFALSLVTTHGIGKRTPLSGFVAKGRGTQGVKALAVDARTGKLAAACLSKQGDDIMIVTTGGVVIRQPAETRLLSRVARGYTMIKLDATDQVVSMARVETVEEAEAAAK
jgi:DNA gyrase subunit A